MAELVMTEQERRTPFLQWDDENLGRAVKAAALTRLEGDDDLERKIPGFTHMSLSACCIPLIAAAVAANSNESLVNINGAENFGDWEITIRRKPTFQSE